MFRENHDHKQIELFNTVTEMPQNVQKRLERSWAAFFYKHVFCKIDEQAFACLYSEDMGRPNFPVNILVAFEILKHRHNLTDEEALDQYYFNMLWRVALGTRNISQNSFGERTLYEFRERLYRHALKNPGDEDIIHTQFNQISEHLKEEMGLDTSEMRADSTQIMPNIRKAGRLSLAYDVLIQALKKCPSELLPAELLKVLEPSFKTDLLYRTKSRDIDSRLEEMLRLCFLFTELAANTPPLKNCSAAALVMRFLGDHADIDPDTKEIEVKTGADVSSDSLQSAYDPDATNRTKNGVNYSGYTANIFETCSDLNPVQMLTDYVLERNNVADTTMLNERLGKVAKTYGAGDLYVDGGYYGEDVLKEAADQEVKMHFTDMTGRPPSKKIPVTQFKIEDNKIIKCPIGYDANYFYTGKDGTLVAHFDRGICKGCKYRNECPIQPRKKSVTIRITPRQLKAAQTREKLKDKEQRRKFISKRAAIEGANSVLKRAYGAGKLAVRGLHKSQVVTGFKMIAYNIRQFERWCKGEYRRRPRGKELLSANFAPS